MFYTFFYVEKKMRCMGKKVVNNAAKIFEYFLRGFEIMNLQPKVQLSKTSFRPACTIRVWMICQKIRLFCNHQSWID